MEFPRNPSRREASCKFSRVTIRPAPPPGPFSPKAPEESEQKVRQESLGAFGLSTRRVPKECTSETLSIQTVEKSLLSDSFELGIARGLLQERPLQFQHGNVRVKSWQPMSKSWSISSQPDFVRALGGRKQHEIAQAVFCTQSCSKVGQLLVLKRRERVPEMGTKPLKALRGYRASNRGSS